MFTDQPNAVTAPADLDRTSAYARATYRGDDTLSFAGELQREMGADASTLYRVGADWQLAPKTPLYSRYMSVPAFGGAYKLGVGSALATRLLWAWTLSTCKMALVYRVPFERRGRWPSDAKLRWACTMVENL